MMTGQVPAVLCDLPVPAVDGLRDLVHARDGGLQEAGRALHRQEHRDHGLVVPGDYAMRILNHLHFWIWDLRVGIFLPVMAILPTAI